MGGLRRWLPSCCCFDRGGGGGGAGRSGSVADDGLLWDVALKAHASGDYSVAVAQANEALEDQAQVLVSPASTLVGVYDGHGGPDAARFVNARLFSLIQEFATENGGLSAEVIKKAFGATEDEFMDMVAKSWPTQPPAPGWCPWAPAAWRAPSRTTRSTSPPWATRAPCSAAAPRPGTKRRPGQWRSGCRGTTTSPTRRCGGHQAAAGRRRSCSSRSDKPRTAELFVPNRLDLGLVVREEESPV